ncbi:CU044_2847 family protein [Catellatospora sp. KI3]|uniref:CU044_2847 family protein n=1 Tax=Catellatospora sp. KI3 TaxID=3041620 RepID=UPI00248237FF|nr:CU044_2847 family protein [Catellatospora sp. KI3]MDI1462462.1 CU044_2847 family protein [Catellatospora sp. KI3]
MIEDEEPVRRAVVPVLLDESGTVAFVEARVLDDEVRIASVPKAISSALTGIREVGKQLFETLAEIQPKRATLEIGIEFAMESGELTALIVNGSAASSVKLTLEWERDA